MQHNSVRTGEIKNEMQSDCRSIKGQYSRSQRNTRGVGLLSLMDRWTTGQGDKGGRRPGLLPTLDNERTAAHGSVTLEHSRWRHDCC